jgi:predicted alpha/beta-fold hydrolase
MKRSTYNKIVSVIESNPWDFESCLVILKTQFPEVTVETLRSILAQEHKKKVKQTHSYQVHCKAVFKKPYPISNALSM